MPAPKKPDDRQFKVGDKIRVNLHHGKIEDVVVRAVVQDGNEVKLQVDVVATSKLALMVKAPERAQAVNTSSVVTTVTSQSSCL